MKALRFPLILSLLLLASCLHKDRKQKVFREESPINIPVDQGFSEYILQYTSGIISSGSDIEIRFAPGFASIADRSASGLFDFDPVIKGKAEWKDSVTLVFTPSKPLQSGKVYNGRLFLGKLGKVKDRLKEFPIHIRIIKKDFRVVAGALKSAQSGNGYTLEGSVVTSDNIDQNEAESIIDVKLGRKKLQPEWDHSDPLVHKFLITNIDRRSESQDLKISWNGSGAGIKRKGSSSLTIPASGHFIVMDVISSSGENKKIDIVFSDPIDPSLELTGLINFNPVVEAGISVSSNIVTVIPSTGIQGTVDMNIESSVRDISGNSLGSRFTKHLDFTTALPGISLEGNGVILPASQNLVFPFRAANLRAVDLKIVKVFENNLPYFLQESNISDGYLMKRFGKLVYSGRIDLVTPTGMNSGTWNLYTVDLSDYIDVEPGVLYRISLGMRKSYSLYPCSENEENSSYENMLEQSEEMNREKWNDPEYYYEDAADEIYYSYGFRWEDRDNPCKDAYYSPDKRVSRNILASNLGLIAKKGADNNLHVLVNDLLSAMPLPGVTIDVYDYQLQLLISGTTDQNGSAVISCPGKPFLIIASKEKDRNYLKLNEGASLSLSSFDVSGSKSENGIKTYIYGERDVWRPGDSIYLSVLIRDLTRNLPEDHPVQFELINPLEQRVDNQVQRYDRNGLLVFQTKTSSNAPTGNYRAIIRVGGATFTKRIRIETIKPNRLKINLDFKNEILGGTETSNHGQLNARWLNGLIAKNMKASVEYLLKHTETKFERYSQYNFDDPVAEFHSSTVNIFEGKTDEEGNASINFNPGKDIGAPGMLNVVFTTKVMEPGGDESIIQSVYPFAPYPVFAGINFPSINGKSRMLYTDKNNEVKIVTLNEKGKPVNSEVQISIYKISYRWWWESDNENLGYYISNNVYKPVFEKTISTSGGEGSFSFNIKKDDWGRYLVRASVPGGHSTGKIILVDWPWEYGMKTNTEGATLLSVSTDKEKYHPGDEVSLTFPSPENSRAIITLENSTGVIDEIMTGTQKGNTVVKFRAKPEMAPNVYAYVSVIQPHVQTVNDMPIRLYGIVPVMIEDPATRLTPEITMPDELRSQKQFTVKVREKDKKPMTYTLAIVDEGLLDITGFKTPDPWNYFFAREALGVQTWDLYDNVLGAFGGTLERIMAVGGDEALSDKSAGKAQRFKPVVKFLGPFTLNAGATKSHVVNLPAYTGSVRVMVVAGDERSFGYDEKTVPVKDPLMVLATLPRVISPGEKVSLPVTIFVQKENIRQVDLSGKGNKLVTFEQSVKSVPVSGLAEVQTVFTFTAGNETGIAKISLFAEGSGEKAVYETELEIRSPNPPEVHSETIMLRKGQKMEKSFTPFGVKGSNSANLEISAMPTINLYDRLGYLISYPHGCTEQVISAAFPQLFLGSLETNDPARLQSASLNVKKAIDVLVSRQMENGGLALWPGSYQPDTWVTSYAGHFMAEAVNKGYSIPSEFRQRWISFQLKNAREWRYDEKFRQSMNDQAYRLFSLALADEPEKGAMNRLRETKDLTSLSRWLLAAAYAQTGRSEVANELLDVRNTQTETEYQEDYYGSLIRDKAVILYTLTMLKNEAQALPLLREICGSFQGNEIYSTQSVAWGLLAYFKWMEKFPEKNVANSEVDITVNGSSQVKTLRSNEVSTSDIKLKEGKNSLLIQNNSELPVYITFSQRGTPQVDHFSPEENGLSMKINYYDLQMKPIDPANLIQGTDFMMVVNITNGTFTGVNNIALSEMIPSGWEIRNTRLFESDYGIRESSFGYRDTRDDRINTYFSLNSGETKTFVVVLSAAYTGEFIQPAILCEAMYKPGLYSRIPGKKVIVKNED
jgi:uncharacterized protein YfaS (alpha-2-macroglobulin family)